MLKDIVGREVTIGSWIAYPGRHSSSLWLNISKVTNIEQYERDRWGVKVIVTRLSLVTLSGRKTFTEITKRLVVIEPPPGAV